jgi:hypothetical protein
MTQLALTRTRTDCVKAKSALQSVGLAQTQYGLLELDSHPRADEARTALRMRLCTR